MKRDSVLVLFARGFLSAVLSWKALLLCLAANAALAFALTHPIASALHGTLDKSPFAGRLLTSADAMLFDNFVRSRPDVLGDFSAWEEIATGEAERSGPEKRRPLQALAGATGASGSLVVLGIASALLASLLAGGFAGRFGADRDAGSLEAFGADVGRFGPSSLVLGVLSIAAIGAAYRWVYAGTGSLYEPEAFRYEWEAVGLMLARLLAFLAVAGSIRLVVLYARAAMGLKRTANPLLGLFSGAGFVARRLGRTMALEILFGLAGILPLVLWGLFASTWDGRDPARLALFVALQQLAVLFRITARVAHLGAASAFMRRAAMAGQPAPAPAVGSPGSPAEASTAS